METYNAADIVDKTLFAKKKILVYRQALDGAVSVGYVNSGQPVGVVYSWLSPNPALPRSVLWWSFYPVNGMYYYAPHELGAFDVSALRAQGVISTPEKIEQEKEKQDALNRPWYETLIKKYWWIPIAGIAVTQVPGVISAFRK